MSFCRWRQQQDLALHHFKLLRKERQQTKCFARRVQMSCRDGHSVSWSCPIHSVVTPHWSPSHTEAMPTSVAFTHSCWNWTSRESSPSLQRNVWFQEPTTAVLCGWTSELCRETFLTCMAGVNYCLARSSTEMHWWSEAASAKLAALAVHTTSCNTTCLVAFPKRCFSVLLGEEMFSQLTATFQWYLLLNWECSTAKQGWKKM